MIPTISQPFTEKRRACGTT